MDRKQQIEKIILKELHDQKMIKKVRLINEYRTVQKLRKEIETLGGDPDAFKQGRKALKGAATALKNSQGPDDDSTGEEETAYINPEDAREDATARGSAGFTAPDEKKVRKSPEEVAVDTEAKQNQIKQHLSQLEKINSELSYKRVVSGRGELSGEETSKHLASVDASHPHLSHITSELRKLLGVK